MSRHQFEAYLDKVFDFSNRVGALPEERQWPQHSWKRVFDAVFPFLVEHPRPDLEQKMWLLPPFALVEGRAVAG